MTEAEWLACDDAGALLAFLRVGHPASPRKLCLLACACCRSVWQFLADDQTRRGVEDLERGADEAGISVVAPSMCGLVDINSPTVGTVYLQRQPGASPYVAVGSLVRSGTLVCIIEAMKVFNEIPVEQAGVIVDVVAENEGFAEYDAPLFRLIPTRPVEGSVERRVRQAALARDIFHYPDRQVLAPALIAPDARAIAQGAYNRGRPHSGELNNLHLAILADALEEAGCTKDDLLTHLRSPGPHVRGCWALDLILGKS